MKISDLTSSINHPFRMGGEVKLSDLFEDSSEDSQKRHPYSIRHIKSQSERVQLVMNENQSELDQLAAVKQNEYAIKYIKNPSEKVQLTAVSQDGWAIQFIKNPSKRVQVASVFQTRGAIDFIENPCKEAQIAAEWEK